MHGTACSEIVHDVAPNAQLYLVNFDTDVEYAQAVDYLISQHVDIVSHSISWFNCDLGDGTGSIDQRVNEAAAAGILWFSAAGNQAQSHYKALYAPCPFYDSDTGLTDWYQMFEPAIGIRNRVTVMAGDTLVVWMRWPQYPFTAPYFAWHDFDLYLLDSATPSNNVVAWSTGIQPYNDTNPGYEALVYTAPVNGTYSIVINDYSSHYSQATPLELFTTTNHPMQYQTAAASLTCPADNANAIAVGATQVSNDSLEWFSSQGPTTDGRAKPDVVAPDRVTTASYGATGFAGTSAAAPHAAGEAALWRGADVSKTMSALGGYIKSSALDLGTAGFDYLYGAGRIALPNPATAVCPVNHFEMSAIPATVSAGTSVPVTITAKDASDAVVTGFNNWVPLTMTTGTVDPWKTGSFASGVWNGTITLTQVALSQHLVASIGAFAITSNAFTVQAGALDHLDVTPITGYANLRRGGQLSLTVQGDDAWHNPIGELTYSWVATGGTLSDATGSTTTYTAGLTPGPGFYARVSSGGISADFLIGINASSGDYDGDGRSETAFVYDYGSGTTRVWTLDYEPTDPNYNNGKPTMSWFSGNGQFDTSRAKID